MFYEYNYQQTMAARPGLAPVWLGTAATSGGQEIRAKLTNMAPSRFPPFPGFPGKFPRVYVGEGGVGAVNT
jgi:hypothetical protein